MEVALQRTLPPLIFSELSPQHTVAHVTFLALSLSDEEKPSSAFCSARALGEAVVLGKGAVKGVGESLP